LWNNVPLPGPDLELEEQPEHEKRGNLNPVAPLCLESFRLFDWVHYTPDEKDGACRDVADKEDEWAIDAEGYGAGRH